MIVKLKPVYELRSTCCNAPLLSGVMSPIDTAPTLCCSKCHTRDKEAEKKYDALDYEGKNAVEQHFASESASKTFFLEY